MDEARDAVPQDGAHDERTASTVMAEVARSATPAASGSPNTATGRLRAAREALGMAGASDETTRVWIDDWRLELQARTYRARIAARGFALDLDFDEIGRAHV